MCANTVLNSTKIVKVLCVNCGQEAGRTPSGNRLKYCLKCRDNILYIDNKLIKDVLGEGSNRFRKIRSNARNKMVHSDVEQSCLICGYSKHVEVAHKKSITSFSMDSLVSEVNDMTNLCYLCPNHHWEHDNP